ncbi:MAG TPA: GEVED domain-containing protein [Pedococcus sp.]|nr:GEVED domain-containing protein [Pedococcus sp.]
MGITLSPAAWAYQVPTSPATINGGVATLTLPGSGLTTTISTTGLTGVTQASTLGSRGYVASDFTPGLTTTTPAVELSTDAVNNCPAVGTCSGLGSITVTFSQPVRNPILDIAGIGGDVFQFDSNHVVTSQSQLHSIFTLTTPGITMTDLSGGNLAVSGQTITATSASTSYRCDTAVQSTPSLGVKEYDAQATAACGSVRLNGIITSVTFDLSALFTRTTSAVPAYTNNNLSDPRHNQDAYVITATAGEDFGDAPASYDQGNAARAILSDLTLGPTVTEDNATVANGAASPNAGPTAALDGGDDGVTLGPLTTAATSYSTTVSISGASKPGIVCGWIDVNSNGIFDTAERACATFAAGATSATLTWSGLSGLTAGNTYARFRVGYDVAQTQSPIGASSAGEVEDYLLPITAEVAVPVIDPRVALGLLPLGGLALLGARRSARRRRLAS